MILIQSLKNKLYKVELNTCRISIQHVNIHQPKKVRISESASDSERSETKIYAISSEGGNIIYHVSNQGRPFSTRTTEELRTFALTTIAEGASGTKIAKNKDIDLPFERINPSDLNLRVNPFGSESSLDKVIFEGYAPPPQLANLQNVTRLNAETCKKEGIYFDDMEHEQQEEEEEVVDGGTAAATVSTKANVIQEPKKQYDKQNKPPIPVKPNLKKPAQVAAEVAEEAATVLNNQESASSNENCVVVKNGDSNSIEDGVEAEPSDEDTSLNDKDVAVAKPGEVEETSDGSSGITESAGTSDNVSDGEEEELEETEYEQQAREARAIVASILEEMVEQICQREEEQIVLQGVTLGDSRTDSLSTENETSGAGSSQQYMPRLRQRSDTQDSETRVMDSEVYSEVDVEAECVKGVGDELPGIHPLHTHILLYTQKFDAQRTLYALTCLKSILTTTPRLVTCAMATSSITSTPLLHMTRLQHLLARHRRSVFGKNFFSDVPNDALSGYRSSMYVEIIISVSLYYIRSYYPNLMMSKLTEQELNGNKEVQILSCEILTLLLSELVNVAKDSGKGFSTYIGDLLSRCKVQKALLHCLLASVYNARMKPLNHNNQNLTEAIISFNEENMDANTNETFQIKLLKLILVLILLEDQIRKVKGEADTSAMLPPEWDKTRLNMQPTLTSVRYVQSRPIVYQTMLLSAILSALKQQHLCHMHRHWIAMVTSALPYIGRALSYTVVMTVNQLCHNLEMLSQCYEKGAKDTRWVRFRLKHRWS